MKLDLTAFENAIAQLEASMSYLESELARNDEKLRNQFRAAAIQAFEFSYELAVKMIRRQLAQIVPNPAELDGMAFMDMMRTGAQAGLVRDVGRFREYREKRNITTHTYDENRAEEVVKVFIPFLEDARFLLAELKRRNNETDRHNP